MAEMVDPRTAAAIATAGLPGEPRKLLSRVADAGVQSVQLSTGQRGTRPRDLDRSGRVDLMVALRRAELRLAGIDHPFDPEGLLRPDLVDPIATGLLEAIQLAGDLGPVPLSVRFPGSGAEEVIAMAIAAGQRVGVELIDFGVPPRGRPVRDRIAASPSGLIVPGETTEAPATHDADTASIEGLAIGVDPPTWLAAGLDFEAAAGEGIAGLRLAGLTADGFRVPAGMPESRVEPATLVAIAKSSGCTHDPVIDPRGWTDRWGGIEFTRGQL